MVNKGHLYGLWPLKLGKLSTPSEPELKPVKEYKAMVLMVYGL